MATRYTFTDDSSDVRLSGFLTPEPLGPSGGTITSPLRIDPTDDSVTALRIDMPVGAAANSSDYIDARSETGGHLFEADASGNFFVDCRPSGQFTVRSSTGDTLLRVQGATATVGEAATTVSIGGSASAIAIGGGSSTVAFYGQTPTVRPTVAGAKLPADVVLASLLTALVALGLVVDNST